MPLEFVLPVLLVLAAIVLPLVLLTLMITLLRRQEDLSYHLGRVEREVDRTQQFVRQMAKREEDLRRRQRARRPCRPKRPSRKGRCGGRGGAGAVGASAVAARTGAAVSG